MQKKLTKVYEKIGASEYKVKSGGIMLLATAKWPNATSKRNLYP